MFNEKIIQIITSVEEYLHELNAIGEKISLDDEKHYWEKNSTYHIAKWYAPLKLE